MLWFKKQPDSKKNENGGDVIIPAVLPVDFDPKIFEHHLNEINKILEHSGGSIKYLEALNNKNYFFENILLNTSNVKVLPALLEKSFFARRRLSQYIINVSAEQEISILSELLEGSDCINSRINKFIEALQINGVEDKLSTKIRRAAYDFAAEILHFYAPNKYPLMTKWVWDETTQSGALREFIRGNDVMPYVPLKNTPEMFEGARYWFANQFQSQGYYKDIPFWIDLILAQAYASYFRAMAEGLLSADFGRSGGPEEYITKFLGIDPPRLSGKPRFKN